MKNNSIRILDCTLITLLLLHLPAKAQLFQEVEIRDIASMNINYGNAVADYDLDGDLDIFIVAYNSFDPGDSQTWSRLLENRGGWFEDATVEAKLNDQYSNPQIKDNKIGASWGDYDGDGYPDLALLHAGKVELFHNDTDGTFTNVSETSNITSCDACVNASGLWWDFDNDSDLDFYVSDYQQPNRLFKNLGDGTFEDVSEVTNLADPGGTWCSIPIDANKDGWIDLYVVNDYGLSRFYINEQGNSFTEATEAYGLRNTGNAMGASIGDFNNDGEFDIYITNIAEFQSNALFVGQASGGFVEKAVELGVGNGHWAWGTCFFDADHDGDEDLYMVNGWGSLNYKNKFFKNMLQEGENIYQDWSDPAACDGNANGMSTEVFDYDADGDLDILVSNTDNKPYFYKNVGQAVNTNWLQIELEGTVSNRAAIGTSVTAAAGGEYWHRFYHGASIMGQSIKPVHFGLAENDKLDSLIINWPNGSTETYYDITVNQKLKVIEQQGIAGLVTGIATPKGSAVNQKEMRISPNPFNTDTKISLDLQSEGFLDLQVFNLQGKKIYESQELIRQPGHWQFSWNGVDNKLNKSLAGTYIIKVTLGNESWSGKVIYNP